MFNGKTLSFTLVLALGSLSLAVPVTGQVWPSNNGYLPETQWVQVDRAKVTLKFPAGWKIQDQQSDDGGTLIAATEPGGRRSMSVTFGPGYVNRPDVMNQCASADALLEAFYRTSFERLATSTNQYPYTSVTHNDFKPDRLGGKSTWVTIVHVEAYKPPVTQEFWLNLIPRKDGVFFVMYQHPSEPMDVSEPLRLGFANSIIFHSQPLGKDDYCNYLGK